MQALALFAFLCGAVLAFRFSFVVLYPIIGLGALTALVLGISAGTSIGATLLGIVVCAVAIQIGYLFGGVVRGTMVAARLAARRRHVKAAAAARRDPQTI